MSIERRIMRKYVIGFLVGLVSFTVVSCATAGGSNVSSLERSDGEIRGIPVVKVYTTDGRQLDCIMIENGTTASNIYSLAMDCDWSQK